MTTLGEEAPSFVTERAGDRFVRRDIASGEEGGHCGRPRVHEMIHELQRNGFPGMNAGRLVKLAVFDLGDEGQVETSDA